MHTLETFFSQIPPQNLFDLCVIFHPFWDSDSLISRRLDAIFIPRTNSLREKRTSYICTQASCPYQIFKWSLSQQRQEIKQEARCTDKMVRRTHQGTAILERPFLICSRFMLSVWRENKEHGWSWKGNFQPCAHIFIIKSALLSHMHAAMMCFYFSVFVPIFRVYNTKMSLDMSLLSK